MTGVPTSLKEHLVQHTHMLLVHNIRFAVLLLVTVLLPLLTVARLAADYAAPVIYNSLPAVQLQIFFKTPPN